MAPPDLGFTSQLNLPGVTLTTSIHNDPSLSAITTAESAVMVTNDLQPLSDSSDTVNASINIQDLCTGSVNGEHGVIAEAWSQGFMVGSIVILIFFVIANMKRKVWLHKLIFLEVRRTGTNPCHVETTLTPRLQLVLASLQGTFIFVPCPVIGWYTSSTAVLLYLSYNVHNIVNWVKIKRFLPRWGSLIYICTIIIVFPFWISQMYLNFAYFNDLGNAHFRQTRPWEAIFREPWWIFTTCYLVYIIHRCYDFSLFQLVRLSPRFCMLMVAMALSIGFIIADIVDTAINSAYGGRNPFWKVCPTLSCVTS